MDAHRGRRAPRGSHEQTASTIPSSALMKQALLLGDSQPDLMTNQPNVGEQQTECLFPALRALLPLGYSLRGSCLHRTEDGGFERLSPYPDFLMQQEARHRFGVNPACCPDKVPVYPLRGKDSPAGCVAGKAARAGQQAAASPGFRRGGTGQGLSGCRRGHGFRGQTDSRAL